MDPVAPLRMSRVLPTPLPYAGSVSRVCACGVKNAGYHSPPSCRCKKIARMPCLVYERGSSTLSFTRNVERNTPCPLSPVLNSVWPSLISEEVQLFGRLPVRSDVQQRHMQGGWGLLWVEMRSSVDLILKNLGAVWSLALIKFFNLSRAQSGQLKLVRYQSSKLAR